MGKGHGGEGAGEGGEGTEEEEGVVAGIEGMKKVVVGMWLRIWKRGRRKKGLWSF